MIRSCGPPALTIAEPQRQHEFNGLVAHLQRPQIAVAQELHAVEIHLGDEEVHVLLDVAAEHGGGAGRNPVAVVVEPADEPVALVRRQDRDVVLADVVIRLDRDAAVAGHGVGDRRGLGAPRRYRDRHHPRRARILVAVFDQPRCRVGVDMIDRLHVDDADLLAFDEGRHRNDQREFLRLALVIARHGDGGGVAVAGQHHLGGFVEQLGVRLGDVEAAECRRRPGQRRELRQHGRERHAGFQARQGLARQGLAGHLLAPAGPAIAGEDGRERPCVQANRCAGKILSMRRVSGDSAISAT